MYSRKFHVDYIRTIAQNGDASAAFNLAWRYHIGHGVIADKTEADKWYERAASSGIREAAEIQQILQHETQCDLELKTLSEPLFHPRTRLLRWLIIASLILGTIAFVAMLTRNISRQPSPPDPSMSPATQPAPVNLANPPIEHPPDSLAPPAIAREEPSPVHPTPQVPARQDVTGMAPNSLTAPAAPRARPDWHHLSHFAQTWLSDQNDFASPPPLHQQ
jgi:hypothetical protein